MAAQLDYGFSIPKAVPGAKVDLSDDKVVARINEADDSAIKYGMAVMVGTNPGQSVKVLTTGATSEQIEGVVLCHPNTEQDMKGNVVVRKGMSLSIMKKGRIWARLATDVTPVYNAKAYVVVSGADAGTFTTVADGNVDIGATFGNATDNGIAVIELN